MFITIFVIIFIVIFTLTLVPIDYLGRRIILLFLEYKLKNILRYQ